MKTLLTLLLALNISFLFGQWTPLPPSGTYANEAFDLSGNSDFWLFSYTNGMSGADLFQSTDAGNSWNGTSFMGFGTFTPLAVEFPTADTGYVLLRRPSSPPSSSLRSYVFRTFDGGQNWTEITPDSSEVGYGTGDVYFQDGLHGAVMIGSSLYLTTDGGASWQTFGGTSGTVATQDMDGPDRDHAIVGGWDGTFLYGGYALMTNDGGISWDTTYFNSFYSNVVGVSYPAIDTAFCVNTGATGFTPADLVRTYDGGITWDTIPLTITLDSAARPVAVHFANTSEGWIALENGIVIHSMDGGNTWSMEYHAHKYLNGMRFRYGMGAVFGDGGFIALRDPVNSLAETPKIDFEVWPNPSSGVFRVRTAAISGSFELELISLSGKVVYKGKWNSSESELDFGSLPDGLYMLRITHSRGEAIKRILISN